MATIRRVYQGLHSLFRTNCNHKCGITRSLSTDFHLHLKTTNHHVLMEMPRLDSTTEFLTEIIRQSKTEKVYGQFFSKSILSQWLSRYVNNKGENSEQTVSVEEFEPLKHRSIEQPDTVVRVTDCVDHASSVGDNLSAVSIRDVLLLPNDTLHSVSQSWDSLDKIIVGPMNSGKSTEAIKKQLKIAARGIPEGSRSMSGHHGDDDKKEFTVFIGSWNVSSKRPPDNLDSWLLVDEPPPDIYAIGFQELDNSVKVFMDSPNEGRWLDQMLSCINTTAKYQKVRSKRLMGMLIVVYIKEKYMNYVSRIDRESVSAGLFWGFVGNKSVRLVLHDTSLCFVNCHLAAHQDEVKERNSDYNDIYKKMKFDDSPKRITDHDIVFWFGDLNYRIDLPMGDVKTLIKNRDYQQLFQADQLRKEREKNSNLFNGFQEGTLNFDPTYKFDAGTDTYDTSDRKRIPSWCDRILWRGSGVEQLRFGSHPDQKVSDQKPISSLFRIKVR